MLVQIDHPPMSAVQAHPRCAVSNECGGCLYQDLPYEDELRMKETALKESFARERLSIPGGGIAPIVASPKPYHYRNRLDLKMIRTKDGRILLGFTPKAGHGMITIESCPIADEPISSFIPRIKNHLEENIPGKHRRANIVVRTGDSGEVVWGGMGKRSCQLRPEKYVWTAIRGKRIFYSLDTFFQANLSILPLVFERLRELPIWNPDAVLYDLYGGVGLFGIGLADRVKRVAIIEECPSSIRLARYNVEFNKLPNFEIIEGKVEAELPFLLNEARGRAKIAMIDPPRAGLSPGALELLKGAKNLDSILYLSCNPEALARDLCGFQTAGWRTEKIVPFDFFPRTKHLEILALLVKSEG
jgi:tRNA/tmRNA/rRNA uracil-C5-methylase (TrmA/RlmC/RlmD family)